MVNALMSLESAGDDLRVTEHSYSLASIGALEAPPSHQSPPVPRRSNRLSARLYSTSGVRARPLTERGSTSPSNEVARSYPDNEAPLQGQPLPSEPVDSPRIVEEPQGMDAVQLQPMSASQSDNSLEPAYMDVRNRDSFGNYVWHWQPTRTLVSGVTPPPSYLLNGGAGSRQHLAPPVIMSPAENGSTRQTESHSALVASLSEGGSSDGPADAGPSGGGTLPTHPHHPRPLADLYDGFSRSSDMRREVELVSQNLDFIGSQSRARQAARANLDRLVMQRGSVRLVGTRRVRSSRRQEAGRSGPVPSLPPIPPPPTTFRRTFRETPPSLLPHRLRPLPSSTNAEPSSTRESAARVATMTLEGIRREPLDINHALQDIRREQLDQIHRWDRMRQSLHREVARSLVQDEFTAREHPHVRARRNAQASILTDLSQEQRNVLQSWSDDNDPRDSLSLGSFDPSASTTFGSSVEGNREGAPEAVHVIGGSNGGSSASNNMGGSDEVIIVDDSDEVNLHGDVLELVILCQWMLEQNFLF